MMEMARCMLHEMKLPKTFWAEAANTTVFMQNRLPTKALNDKTPFEDWYVFKPSLTFLVVFFLLMFHRLSMTNLTRKQFLASLWAIVQFCSGVYGAVS